MKALVTVKRVIDYNVKVRIKPDGSDVDLTHVKMAMNPFCEIAIEEAVRLKEKGVISEIIVVSIGAQVVQEQLRAALAMGADRGILIQTDQTLGSFSTAKILKTVVESENPNLIIMGKQSIDSDNNQTGQMLAALLGWGQGTFASELTVHADTISVTREVDGGLSTVELNLPALVTVDLRLNTPRYVSVPNIMKAKRKTIDITALETLNLSLVENNEILSVESPPTRQAGIQVKTVDELLDKLKNEAKVLS
ncbi:MAG: electron transfer flavoprotein subunit beta/FixA family protein [Endozoicomonadaceae bacterium]|nr:electron transfer flavoprotein subunit beta/FixA family protein [Endozoicomonadaceae bacterium]